MKIEHEQYYDMDANKHFVIYEVTADNGLNFTIYGPFSDHPIAVDETQSYMKHIIETLRALSKDFVNETNT